MPRCVALVADLMFGSKITTAARQHGVACSVVRDAGALRAAAAGDGAGTSAADLVIIDLEALQADLSGLVADLRGDVPDVAVIGFLPHVRTDLAANARDCGLDAVMARSAFAAQLPKLLQRLRQQSD